MGQSESFKQILDRHLSRGTDSAAPTGTEAQHPSRLQPRPALEFVALGRLASPEISTTRRLDFHDQYRRLAFETATGASAPSKKAPPTQDIISLKIPSLSWKDISPEAQRALERLYQLLGRQRPEELTERALKSLYRALAKRYHPDSAADTPESNQRFIELKELYRAVQVELSPFFKAQP